MSEQTQQLVCLNCGFPNLVYHHCKIVCENCGFLLDCSDLDVGGEIQRAAIEQQRQQRHQAELQQSDSHSPT